VIWDRDGSRFGAGAGFSVSVDGKKAYSAKTVPPVVRIGAGG
jgi:hypothetical protein